MTGDDKGQELWATDGTVEGTVRVTDTNPGAAAATPHLMGSMGRYPIFASTDPERGRALWYFEPPVAEARGPHEDHPWPQFYRAVSGYSVVLNGQWSLQSDYPSEEVLKFEWDMDGDGIFGERGIADAPRGDEVGMRPRFSAVGVAPGTYRVRLRVTDAMGVRDEDEVDVIVSVGEVKQVVGTDGPDRWRFSASEETFYVYDHAVSV